LSNTSTLSTIPEVLFSQTTIVLYVVLFFFSIVGVYLQYEPSRVILLCFSTITGAAVQIGLGKSAVFGTIGEKLVLLTAFSAAVAGITALSFLASGFILRNTDKETQHF